MTLPDMDAPNWLSQTWQERFRTILRLYNGAAATLERMGNELNKANDEIERLQGENARLALELQASTGSMNLLGAELNEGNRASVDEILRLRELLKANSIPIGG